MDVWVGCEMGVMWGIVSGSGCEVCVGRGMVGWSGD